MSCAKQDLMYHMTPVMIEKKPGRYVIPLWDRRPRGIRTIRLLAGVAGIDTMIVVDLNGSKCLFETKE